ncbi:hypothetical protein JHK87_001862 [Glycine soja]|nr:hypothetical protein JHK87_001862 [Glycine soja]
MQREKVREKERWSGTGFRAEWRNGRRRRIGSRLASTESEAAVKLCLVFRSDLISEILPPVFFKFILISAYQIRNASRFKFIVSMQKV